MVVRQIATRLLALRQPPQTELRSRSDTSQTASLFHPTSYKRPVPTEVRDFHYLAFLRSRDSSPSPFHHVTTQSASQFRPASHSQSIFLNAFETELSNIPAPSHTVS